MTHEIALQSGIHGALIQLLLGNKLIVSLLKGPHVFTHRPDEPGLHISFVSFQSRSLLGEGGRGVVELFLELGVSTEERGRALATALVQACEGCLTAARPQVSGWAVKPLNVVFWSVGRSQDGTFGGSIRIKTTAMQQQSVEVAAS